MMKLFKDTKDLNENLRKNNLLLPRRKLGTKKNVSATLGAYKVSYKPIY